MAEGAGVADVVAPGEGSGVVDGAGLAEAVGTAEGEAEGLASGVAVCVGVGAGSVAVDPMPAETASSTDFRVVATAGASAGLLAWAPSRARLAVLEIA